MTKGVLGGGNRERRQRGAKQLETGGVTGRKRVCVRACMCVQGRRGGRRHRSLELRCPSSSGRRREGATRSDHRGAGRGRPHPRIPLPTGSGSEFSPSHLRIRGQGAQMF